MTGQVRRLAAVMLVLFAALFVNLNIVQLLRADDLANHPNNRRLLINEYRIQRGPVVVGEQSVAFSEATADDLKYLRRYEPPLLYAHLLGFYSIVYGRDGIEAALNEALTGTPTEVLAQNLAELLGDRDQIGNTVRLTVDPAVQQAAVTALGDRPGAVVAIEPRSGAILAQVSNPVYDPNRLSSHDPADVRDYWTALQADSGEPLVDRSIQERYQPGSTFKLIVAAAALEHGLTPDSAFEDTAQYTPPTTTRAIHNFGGGTCTGGGTISLATALIRSCNTVFAKLGVDLGADAIVAQAERFGFNRRPPHEFDDTVAVSVIPHDLDQPATAQSAIGARDVQATTLQMAMIAAAIANDGVLMRPHVVAEVLDPSGRRIRGPAEGPWIDGPVTAQAVDPANADVLADLMVRVVQEGTGRGAQIPGVTVGGKTGTADPGEGLAPHAWFVGFASTPDDAGQTVPRVAVAAVLPNAGEGATGGQLAAPVARAVMAAAVGAG